MAASSTSPIPGLAAPTGPAFVALPGHDPDGPALVVAGELDMATVPSLIDAAQRLWPALFQDGGSAARVPHAVRVDASALTFVDVAGLRALQEVHRRAQALRVSVRLHGCSDGVRRVIALCGFAVGLPPDHRAERVEGAPALPSQRRREVLGLVAAVQPRAADPSPRYRYDPSTGGVLLEWTGSGQVVGVLWRPDGSARAWLKAPGGAVMRCFSRAAGQEWAPGFVHALRGHLTATAAAAAADEDHDGAQRR